MIQRILAVLGFCFFTASHQMSYQQALRLSNITSLQQLFTEAHINRDGMRVENVYEVLPQLQTSGDQIYVGIAIGDLAMPDECSPRLTTVEVPRDGVEDVNVQLWPRCTRVKRCGGCCANNMLKCVPKSVQPKVITVLKARLWDSRSTDLLMDWEGYMEVELLEHTACNIACRVSADDCNRRQQFYESECACRCRVVRRCNPLQRWDMETCRCMCKNPNRVCRPGTVFNPRNCRCRISRVHQTYANLEVDSEEEGQNDISASSEATASTTATTPSMETSPTNPTTPTSTVQTTPPSTVQTTPTSTTQSTTTTTTTPATPTDPCVHTLVFCPPMFEKVFRNGGCVCKPPFSFLN